jgi:hypothetical protein
MQALYAAAPAWVASGNNVVGMQRRTESGLLARVSCAAAMMPGMAATRSSRSHGAICGVGIGERMMLTRRRKSMQAGDLHDLRGGGFREAAAVSKEVFAGNGLRIRRTGRRIGGEIPLGLGIGLNVRAQAAAAAEGGAFPSENASTVAPRKFFGVETTTIKKVLPLGLMFFCILFNYTILRDTKDVLVVTAKGSSAEIIPFLKTWVNLPMAIGFMIIYTKLSNVLSKEQLFYSCIFPFIAFFGTFAFFMYPLVDILHPTAFADFLVQKLGTRFLGPIAIVRNWTFVLFYVMAELWGSVVVSVLFWGFANQVCTLPPIPSTGHLGHSQALLM